MANLEKGNIVKFINVKGELDGGTIVGFGTDAQGIERAIINTVEGHRIQINKSDLIAIKHQRKGTAGKKLQKRLIEEIQESRKNSGQVTPPIKPAIEKENSKRALTPQALDLKLLKERVSELETENKRLREEIENTKCPYEVERLIKTVRALKQAISDGIILSDDKSQSIIPLLDLIMFFNGLSENESTI